MGQQYIVSVYLRGGASFLENKIALMNQTIDAAWNTYRDSETVSDFLGSLIKSLARILGADSILFYLEDETIISEIVEGENHPIPVFSSYFVLSSAYSRKEYFKPKTIIQASTINRRKFSKISNAVNFQTIPWNVVTLSSENINELSCALAFESPKINLCRALLIVNQPKKDEHSVSDTKLIVGQFLDFVIPAIEAVYRRQIDRLSRKIFSSGDRYYSGDPGHYFRQSFVEVCKLLRVEGASLIVKGLPSSVSKLQLVATYPKKMPNDRNVYAEDVNSPTQWVFSFGSSCLIQDIQIVRNKLYVAYKESFSTKPIWCDASDSNLKRSIVYNFYQGQGEITYLLRCTNSKKNPSQLFHVLDRKIGQELVVSFALMHKAIENEYRAMQIFLSVKHEFRQKLTGIYSAACYTESSLKKQPNTELTLNERVLKLSHIKNTVDDVVRMLGRFTFPLPDAEVGEKEEIVPFKPYADLVKSVCETFVNKASKRGLYFTYHGQDQLGLVYSNLASWKQVVENMVNNMVKYTFENEEMAVALQRDPKGGGWIHFASRSIPISEEEKDQIFEFRYRTKTAIEQTNEGDGIGLSIAKFYVSFYGGQILVKTTDGINVFSIRLPSHLFRPSLAR